MTEEKDRSADLLIREVDEELQREQYAKLWKRYGGWVIGAAVAVVAIVAGYQGWGYYTTERQKDEAQRFASALNLMQEGETEDAITQFASISGGGDTGYAMVARFHQADLLARKGDRDAALSVFGALAADSGVERRYRDLAVLRGVLLKLDDAEPQALRAELQSLEDGVWRHSARELLALLALRQGETDAAAELFRALADDATAPQGIRARAAEILAAVGDDAAANG